MPLFNSQNGKSRYSAVAAAADAAGEEGHEYSRAVDGQIKLMRRRRPRLRCRTQPMGDCCHCIVCVRVELDADASTGVSVLCQRLRLMSIIRL